MLDKDINKVYNKEDDNSLSENMKPQENKVDISVDIQAIETKLTKEGQSEEERLIQGKIDNELLSLKNEVQIPVQKTQKVIDTSGLPPTIRQSFDQAQQQYGRSEEVKKGREDAYRRVQSLENSLPARLVSKANA